MAYEMTQERSDSLRTTVVGPTSVFRGNVEFSGAMRVEGSVVGDIAGSPASGSRLWINETGTVLGDIHVTEALIEGQVNGDVYCLGYLELGASATITGDVHYGYLEMHMGASVIGMLLRHGVDASDTNGGSGEMLHDTGRDPATGPR